MKTRFRLLTLAVGWGCLLVLVASALGENAVKPVWCTWDVAGVKREALVYGMTNAKEEPRPLVIVFHGHGGSMQTAAQAFRVHELWPEAVVIYPQGLLTAGRLVDQEGRLPGWQMDAGDHGDRDLLFFDAILERFQREGRVNPKQIFVAGHSNGGAFIYLLWANRSGRIAAYASSAAAWLGPYAGLKPGKLLMFSGEKDDLVKFAWQRRTFDNLLRFFDCNAAKRDNDGCLVADSKSGAHIAAYVHAGGHQFPSAAPQLIVKFFKASIQP